MYGIWTVLGWWMIGVILFPAKQYNILNYFAEKREINDLTDVQRFKDSFLYKQLSNLLRNPSLK